RAAETRVHRSSHFAGADACGGAPAGAGPDRSARIGACRSGPRVRTGGLPITLARDQRGKAWGSRNVGRTVRRTIGDRRMSAPDVGDSLPDIALETPDGGSVRATDFRGRKLVVFFYPKDDTPGCTVENKDFSDLLPEFEKAGVAVLGVSKDPPAKHAKFAAKHGLTVPLATDGETGLSDALGVWGEKSLYGRKFMGMI